MLLLSWGEPVVVVEVVRGKLVQMLKIRENMKRMTSSQTPLPHQEGAKITAYSLDRSTFLFLKIGSLRDKEVGQLGRGGGKYLSSRDSLLFSVLLRFVGGWVVGHSSRQPQECARLPCMLASRADIRWICSLCDDGGNALQGLRLYNRFATLLKTSSCGHRQ